MTGVVAHELKQQKPFSSSEQEVLLGLRMAAARVVEPWARFLQAALATPSTRSDIRGSIRPLACSDIMERMIERDPDITRLVDRLETRGLVKRSRSRQDRRVVEVGMTEKGFALVRGLDVHVQRLPKALLGHLGVERTRQLATLLEAVIADLGTFP
jgi:DNA-binding MarR family transcriptional regulator